MNKTLPPAEMIPVWPMAQKKFKDGLARSGSINIHYEDRGPKNKPAIVFVMGLASQMIRWPEDLLNAVSKAGFRVIRLDNRDIGMSTHLDETPPSIPLQFLKKEFKGEVEAPYDLSDMSGDVIAVLDHLKIKKAHLVGTSMGGMICQLTASLYPERVLSLASLISGSNDADLPRPDFKILLKIGLGRSDTREAYIERGMQVFNLIGSQGELQIDQDLLRQNVTEHYERGISAEGIQRQILAVWKTGSLRPYLGQIKAPTLVIHGEEDKLIRLPAGIDSAMRIPGAIMKIFKGMAHDLPRAYRKEMAGLIVMNAKRKPAH